MTSVCDTDTKQTTELCADYISMHILRVVLKT